MKVHFVKSDPLKIKTDCLIIGVLENQKLSRVARTIDQALKGIISSTIKKKDFQGKLKELFSTYTLGAIEAKSVIFVGLGKKEDLTLEKLRQASGIATKGAKKLKAKKISSLLADTSIKGSDADSVAQASAEGSILSIYEFNEHKTDKEKGKKVEDISFLSHSETPDKGIAQGLKRAKSVCDAVYLARDLITQPGNTATPTFLANEAKKIAAKSTLQCKILNLKDMEKLGMGALIGVTKGSAEPPKFIILEHKGGKKGSAPVVLVGKGLTFDSGGISIKPGQGMEEMKTDMSGGAAVIAAMKAVSALKLKLNVVGLVPASENLPDGKANKPGDVLTAMSGQTIEVINTDAEGRLILADALCYAEKFKPRLVIDIATLTGACVVALGHHASGLMGTDQKLMDSLVVAGEVTGERVWPLPLFEEYDEQIKSDVADMKNIGGRAGGSITAAAMLKKFTGKYPWAHVDIAGTAWTDKAKPYIPKGAAGVGVRLFVQLLRDLGS